jgi:hypothetical protein
MIRPVIDQAPNSRWGRIAPGLAMLCGDRREWLRADLGAGLSVAAVALPTAIASAQLAGFPPVVAWLLGPSHQRVQRRAERPDDAGIEIDDPVVRHAISGGELLLHAAVGRGGGG